MAFSSGVFTLISASNPVVTGTVISSTWANNTLTDIADNGLSLCVLKDGTQTITANLPMATFRHTGVGNAAARTDYAAAGQVADGALTWCGTAGGTANALTLTPSPAITAYAVGQKFRFKAGSSANSGATTVAISGLSTIAVQHNGAACVGTEIAANMWYEVTLDTTATCQLNRLNLGPRFKIVSFTRDVSTASGTQAVTGVGGTPIVVIFAATITTTNVFSIGFDDGTTHLLVRANDGITTDTWAQASTASIWLQVGGAATDYYGSITTLGSDGFTVTWTKEGSPTGTATINALCFI